MFIKRVRSMDIHQYKLASLVILTIIYNAQCQCTCTTTPRTHEYFSENRGRLMQSILHHSVCVAVIEPVVMETEDDLSSDETADPCCCRAYWRHVPSLGRGNMVYVKTVYYCETVDCSNL